jgi:hypothetical protein
MKIGQQISRYSLLNYSGYCGKKGLILFWIKPAEKLSLYLLIGYHESFLVFTSCGHLSVV